jgi:hypothetical protein
VTEAPDISRDGSLILSDKQYVQVKRIIAEIFQGNPM